MATEQRSTEALEQELQELIQRERFDPPEEFRQRALLTEPSVYEEAERDPEGWWERQAEELTWFNRWDQVLDESNPPFFKWFVGGKTNMAYNCLDRHVESGNGDKVAFHWHGEEGETEDWTYADFLRESQKLANGLKSRGIGKGEVVGIFLPMIPEVIVSMQACARIGAIHNVVFGGFSATQAAERMAVSSAKALITAGAARRKGQVTAVKSAVDEAMGELESLETIVVVDRTKANPPMTEGRDVFYDELLAAADGDCPAEELDAEDPLYILYSSGSTAKPKGILHTTGGHMTGVAWTTRYVFDLKPDEDVFWCSADVGWVTGHSYIVYGPMLNGVTSVMYEGAPDYPDKDAWWALVEKRGVTVFYTAPTAIRGAMKWGVEYPERRDLSSLRLLGSVGEPINPKAWAWYHQVIGGGRCPIVDTWWQTETGHIMISPLPGMTATKPGSATVPLPGIRANVVDENGEELREGQGLLVLERPWPGMLRTLYRDDERFREIYFGRFGPRRYVVGDAARRDEDGYFWIVGRVDDAINVSGHLLSTAEIESAIVSYEKVAEAAVVPRPDEDKGQAVVAFVTLQGDAGDGGDQLAQELREHVAKRIGKLARPDQVVWASGLPKTRSGKIMRRLLKDISQGREYGDTTTLADPSVMDELEEKVKAELAS